MTPEQLQMRTQRAEIEPLVISKSEEGFRVYSPMTPGRQYVVTGTAEGPVCTCPDFEYHKEDPNWRCKHILAVFKRSARPQAPSVPENPDTADERVAIQAEGRGTTDAPSQLQMVIKRSVSPDHRIDSLSVEFSSPVGDASGEEVRSRAISTLRLQSDIVDAFLEIQGEAGEGNSHVSTSHDESVPAKLLGIWGMNTRRGRSLFIEVQTNGKTIRLFGSKKELADAIVAAGNPRLAERIEEGARLNLPCRVVTKPSEDGRYQNVERVLPPSSSHQPGGAR